MKKEKVWVWFKGGLQGGKWIDGFIASSTEEGGYIIEKPDFVSCIVPEWRIKLKEPSDKEIGPTIPKNATWKHS